MSAPPDVPEPNSTSCAPTCAGIFFFVISLTSVMR